MIKSMPRLNIKRRETKEQKEKKEHTKPRKKRHTKLESFWAKHWEVIIAAIAGLIVGAFVVPKFFR
jgi:hypothetical protein